MKKIRLLFLFQLVFFLPIEGKTEPLLISFAEMMEQTETIVIARYEGMPDGGVFGPYLLNVSEVIKGNINTGIIETSLGAGQVDLEIGTECIAFLREDGSFEWVATIEDGEAIQEGLLSVRGFYDYNAYLVYPSRMTLNQIKKYLQTSTLDYQLEGDLYFFSDKSQQMGKSDISFSVNYTYAEDTTYWQVDSQNLSLIDFSELPKVSLSAWESIINLEYESNLIRPLKVEGQILEQKDDIFQVLFWVESPEEITYQDFKKYLKKPEWGNIYYELEVKHNNKAYPFMYHQETGRIGNLEGFQNRFLACQSLSRDALEFRLGDGTDLVIKFESEDLTQDLVEYSSDGFIRELRLNPFQGSILKVQDDKEIENYGECELVFKAFHFTENPNFGK